MGITWPIRYKLPHEPPPALDLSTEVNRDVYIDLARYDWPFENLVLEGGGTKGTAYPGAIQVLEDVGILQRIKRFGGTSSGASAAGLLSVGFKSGEIAALLDMDQRVILKDARGGYFSLVPNFLRLFGWNPGDRYLNLLKMCMRHKTGNPDYTFRQLYDDKGIELCIVCANVSKKNIEYFHPKTTPDVPIALAMRMSASIPVFFQPKSLEKTGNKHYLVDGGLICPYPIHVFDGWFLSMRPEDSFFKKLGTEEDPFERPMGEFSNCQNSRHKHETIGIVLYATDELDLMRVGTNSRDLREKASSQRPDTPLARLRGQHMDKVKADEDKKLQISSAAKTVFRAFHDKLETRDSESLRILFGDNFDIDSTFRELDNQQDKQITAVEFFALLEKKGVISPLESTLGFATSPILSVKDYFSALLATVHVSSQKQYITASDVERTIGVCTDYIRILDLNMEAEDKLFLRQQGRLGTVSFLRGYLQKNSIPLKK
ncbi:uncharacterized protein LOC106166111 [Lingula anatina]|uniref:Uncharacterized protein LOC106166111 n=1 Tax=Lingula anatina TaxID=7574 RepID=A0A2R2MKF2_LINAN|nr:uncharacterized protein LOC106166111 [Lingula anatina]|eukprot:XP_023930680.1 uncharacterized protein LOC106166111 [Lingula anatina]